MLKNIFNFLIYSTICLSLIGCKAKIDKENQFIQIDVNASSTEKAINLSEIADIEYLQLDFNDEFLFNEPPENITDSKLIIHQLNGDILVFLRSGKPLSKFNHTGNGPGEYASITGKCFYDEAADEIYVRTWNKLMVYSLSGLYRREIPLLEEDGASITNIVVFDSETLLLHDENVVYASPFVLISKQDGSVLETVNLPVYKRLILKVLTDEWEGGKAYAGLPLTNILRYNNGYLLSDFSNDTIYFFSREKVLSPIMVRKPEVQSMNPVIALHGFVEAGNYEFMFTTKVQLENKRLPRKYLMRDKTTGSMFVPAITFDDYRGKVVDISPFTVLNTTDSKLGVIVLSMTELKDANLENKLSGRLKELVDNSDEEGNDIYMLLHFK
ncbi:MAG: 6-bladed beta-propeller [Tannerella sp.]|jgi:hypothetical protein|nr:6-bladed beta-propeller [Tannerella sp.]